MARLTVRLPESLHSQLVQLAKQEGVSLNNYIVYSLTHHVTGAYRVEPVAEEEARRQRDEYAALLQRLGEASHREVQQVLSERENAEPEPGLTPEVPTWASPTTQVAGT